MRVVPGKKYGVIHGELIPNCRSISQMLTTLDHASAGLLVVKLHSNITDDDPCQRGPTGDPLGRVTPGVPYFTKKEWEAVRTKQ